MLRRTFLKTSVAALGGITFAPSVFASSLTSGWYNGFKDRDGRFGVAHISSDLDVTPLFYTPIRLHGLSVNQQRQEIIAPARRPGTQLFVCNLQDKSVRFIEAAPERHFFGHGIFSRDQKLYFATEAAYEEEKGIIGVYDVTQDYKRIDEFDCGGIGPHEMRLSQDGKTLVISNGGILTHPEMGHLKLNLDTMAPNLSYIDVASGALKSKLVLPSELHQLSIRHMDVGPDDTAYIGLQDQQKNRFDQPLVWKTQDNKLVALPTPKEGWKVFNGYVGSVRANHDGLCVTSPRGNLAHIWKPSEMQVIASQDICGLSQIGKHDFLMTTGQGNVFDTKGRKTSHSLRFDNHCA